MKLRAFILLLISIQSAVLAADYNISQLGKRFDDPWSLAFISEDKFLLAELTGELKVVNYTTCLLYTSPSPRDKRQSRMPSSA